MPEGCEILTAEVWVRSMGVDFKGSGHGCPIAAARGRGEVAKRPFHGPDIAAAARQVDGIMIGKAHISRTIPASRRGLHASVLAGILAGALLVLAGAPALAFDGTAQGPGTPQTAFGPAPLTPPVDVPMAPAVRPVDEAFRTGARALRAGNTAKGIDALGYAAAQGHAMAQWKLGRIYADGDGVKRDDAKAFDYFSKIANTHAEDYPGTPQSRFVANAFVALGSYYLVGVPAAGVKRDPQRARDMFSYAASYFGDADAQLQLGKLYLDGVEGMARDPRNAGRWLTLAAQKGQFEAQALLGRLLFHGDSGVPRQAARGLMWLTLARDAASRPEDKWVVDAHEEAFGEATPNERALALSYLESWLNTAKR